MAKTTYVSSRNNNFLTKLIIGFAVIIVALVAGLVIYNVTNPEYTYSDFDHINSFYSITTQPEDSYFVYYYSETCSHCNEIKSQVLDFAHKHQGDIKIYFLDAAASSATSFPIYDPLTGEEMRGTPSIIMVKNGQIMQMAPGSDKVIDILTSVEDGTYAYLN